MEAPSWYAWLMGDIVNRQDFRRPPAPGAYMPQLSHLATAVPCALALLLLRFVFERLLMRPIGRHLGLSERRVSPPASFARMQESLESHYRREKRPDQRLVGELSRQLGYSEKSIVNWFIVRRVMDKPSKLDRFSESAWYVLYYSCVLAYGAFALWDEPYLWDSEHLWTDWPRHHVPPKIFWYYMVQLGFYLVSMSTLAFDIRRKDFGEMATHHAVTVMLILLSWALNFVRVGALTLLLHDIVDPVLNSAKLWRYAEKLTVSNALFATLVVVWIVSRLVLLPYRVVYSVYADSLRVLRLPIIPAYCIFLAGFCALQLLHCMWTWFLVKAVLRVVTSGQSAEDVRSESESSCEEEEEEEEEEDKKKQ